jgi:hypothetical protein
MQRPLAFDATREVIGLFSAAFPFWPRGRPPSGAWRPHQVSPFPREAATGCSWSAISIAAASALRRTRTTKSLRYSIRSVGPESLCPGCRISGQTACFSRTLLHAAERQPLESAPHQCARTQIESVFFCEAEEKDATDTAKEIAGRNNACRPLTSSQALDSNQFTPELRKARLLTRLGSGAETADHFTRLFFSRLRPCKSPWWNIGSLGLSRE